MNITESYLKVLSSVGKGNETTDRERIILGKHFRQITVILQGAQLKTHALPIGIEG